jgi:hypothetical protein
MLELYITFFFFILFYIYRKYFNKNYTEGEWLIIDEDLKFKNLLEWDISNRSFIKIANFKNYTKYFLGKDLYHKLGDKEAILMNFKEKKSILDVYNKNMENIYHIIDPDSLIFSPIENENYYILNSNEEYIFFLRSDKKTSEYRLLKYKDITKFDFEIKIQNQLIHAVDENDLYDEFKNRCIELRDSMQNRGFFLVDIKRSEEYISFPSNIIANKLVVFLEKGDIVILVCTNKSKTTNMNNHIIEINSLYNNIEWSPDNEENISHLVLDNCDDSGKFTFYERTTNISNGSNILNFDILIFKKK